MQKSAKVGYDGTYTSRGREARRVFVRFSDAPILCPYFIFVFSFYLVAKNNAQKIQQQQQQNVNNKSQSIRVHLGEDIGSAIIANGMICDLSPTLNLFFFC
jgi:hypothetical protein